uniref:IBH1-like N-terminal domain-containing protein n=2 Tax=Kalanchoe fedtschenkoi TaxID=63787 RepID=A0A7N0UI07_KALFE
MASVMSNPVTNSDRSRESRRRRKKKSTALSLHQTQNGAAPQNQNQMMDSNRWRTASEQQNYSSKLLQALRHVRTTPPSAPASSCSAPRRGRAIREAADRVLAVTAKGRTRWSRAILTNRLKLKFLKAKKPKVVSPIMGTSRTRKPRVSVVRLKAKNLPAVQKKARVLGNLVPGCRKQPLPVILEEAHDYISALEMQVRAMTALAELLSVAGAVSGSPPPRPAP